MERTLHLTNPLERGDDVKALQAALHAHGYTVPVDGVFGPHTAAAVKRAKWDLGYPENEIRPVAGARFVRLLAGGDRPAGFRVLALERHHAHAHEDAIAALRTRIVDVAQWGIRHEPEIHYAMVRPIEAETRPWTLPLHIDCSGFVSICYSWGGAAHDPNGDNYNGLGYTGTLLEHGKPITASQAKPADVVVFGEYPGHHTALVLEAGADPLLASHGQERGPFEIRFSEERKYQPHGVSFRTYL